MNYEKLSGSIRAVIDRRPGDNGAYSDLFSLCREWETEDFSAAHKVNKELLALSADQVVRGGGAKFYEQWRRCLLFEAPHDFDSFMTYIELDRKPEKRFYAPRKHYLRPMVQGFQDVLDGKLRLLTISMPKRAGKSQTGINFVNMLSGKFPDRSTLMEGTGDDLVKSFYNGCLEYLTVPNEYLFYDVFPDARLIQTNADSKTINLKSKSRFPTIMCRSMNKDSTKIVRHKLRAFRGKLDRGEMTLADIRCSVDSYNGHMKRGHSFKVRQRTNQYFKSLYGFYPDEKGWKSHV